MNLRTWWQRRYRDAAAVLRREAACAARAALLEQDAAAFRAQEAVGDLRRLFELHPEHAAVLCTDRTLRLLDDVEARAMALRVAVRAQLAALASATPTSTRVPPEHSRP